MLPRAIHKESCQGLVASEKYFITPSAKPGERKEGKSG
jgi:hypothetical protein